MMCDSVHFIIECMISGIDIKYLLLYQQNQMLRIARVRRTRLAMLTIFSFVTSAKCQHYPWFVLERRKVILKLWTPGVCIFPMKQKFNLQYREEVWAEIPVPRKRTQGYKDVSEPLHKQITTVERNHYLLLLFKFRPIPF